MRKNKGRTPRPYTALSPRWPAGPTIRFGHFLMLVSLLVPCSTAKGGSFGQSVPAPGGGGSSALTVVVSDASSHMRLPDVRVIGVKNSGELAELGITNVYGEVRIEKPTLRGTIVLLFCRERFFCGALLVGGSDLLEYGETTIHLAPFYVQ